MSAAEIGSKIATEHAFYDCIHGANTTGRSRSSRLVAIILSICVSSDCIKDCYADKACHWTAQWLLVRLDKRNDRLPVEEMRKKLRNDLGVFLLGSVLASASLAQDVGMTIEERAFQDAISAAEKRNYAQLGFIVEQTPSVLDHRTEAGDDLFHEFRYVFHEDADAALGYAIDLEAIETLLDKSAVPSVSNGLLGTLLSVANDFDGEIDAFPINSGQCTENREEFFPVIGRLIEAGAEFGILDTEVLGLRPSEAFFYQYQLCLGPFVCGGGYERPSELVKHRVSTSTTQTERELLLMLATRGSQDLNCLISINDW